MRHCFTRAERQRGGIARSMQETFHDAQIKGYEELCNRHGKQAARRIIAKAVKKRGGKG